MNKPHFPKGPTTLKVGRYELWVITCELTKKRLYAVWHNYAAGAWDYIVPCVERNKAREIIALHREGALVNA